MNIRTHSYHREEYKFKYRLTTVEYYGSDRPMINYSNIWKPERTPVYFRRKDSVKSSDNWWILPTPENMEIMAND